MTRPENPLIVALDVASAEEAVALATTLKDHVGGFKVGLELLMGPGPSLLGIIDELGRPVFCDAKLHDIPTTVRRAARRLGRFGARWVTVHASGGSAMLEAAVEGLQDGAAGRAAGVMAVTVLTSLDDADLAKVGVAGSSGKQVSRLARLASECGVEGVVCSVKELGDVAQVAPGLVRATPGIRPAGEDPGDQARVATPGEAAARGADLIIVGRPITRAGDPVRAAQRVVSEALAGRPL